MSNPIRKEFCTAADAAEIIGVSQSQITRYIQAGLLKVERVGNQIFLLRKQCENFKRPKPGNPAFKKLANAG